jgi:DNA-binding CsgD family transcriptional regulator
MANWIRSQPTLFSLPRGHQRARPNARPDGLTAREIEVLCLVVRGASNKAIAASPVIGEKTARNHVERTYAKIGVPTGSARPCTRLGMGW